MNNILVIISTGWAVRNFVESGFLAKLADKKNVTVVSNNEVFESLKNYDLKGDVDFIQIDIPLQEPRNWTLVRQLKKKFQQNILGSSTEYIWQKYVSRPIYQRAAGKLIDIIFSRSVCRVLLKLVEKLELLINQNSSVKHHFNKKKFDTVFFTNLSNYFDDSFANFYANKNDVKKFFMVLSWDHVSSKVVLRTDFDKVFVWNEISKKEIITLELGYTTDSVVVVGIPQYEPYKSKPKISREQWLEHLDISPRNKIILFCTIPQVRTNDQHLKLQSLIQRIRSSSENYFIIVRLHPLDNVNVYKDLIADNKDIIKFERDYKEKWMPSGNEIENTKNSLNFSDVIVNTFSTITIEASIFDKPIVHIAYDKNDIKNRIPCHEYYNFQHFKPIVKYDATILVRSDDELFSAIQSYINDPTLNREQRKNLAQNYFDKNINSLDKLLNEFQ